MPKINQLPGYEISQTYAGLLRAVWENPDDDTPRLVFADHLDETDDPVNHDRAAFIRRQIEAARSQTAHTTRFELWHRLGTARGWVWTPSRILHYRPWATLGGADEATRKKKLEQFQNYNIVRVRSANQSPSNNPEVIWHRGFPAFWGGFDLWNLEGAARWLPVAEFAGLGRPRNMSGWPYNGQRNVSLYATTRPCYVPGVSNAAALRLSDLPIPDRWYYFPTRFRSQRGSVPRFIADEMRLHPAAEKRADGIVSFTDPTSMIPALSHAIGVYLYGVALMALSSGLGGYGGEVRFWPVGVEVGSRD